MMQYLQELPLVLFTLLIQMSLGIILVGQCIIRCGVDNPVGERARQQTPLALALFIVAALLSLGHTGTPLHGPFTLLNISSSWLSREIFMVALTGLAMLWLAYLRFRKPPSSKECPAVAVVIVLGLILTFAMSSVYTQKNMPGWNNPSVFPLFLSSIFMLGALWHGLALGFKNTEFKSGSAGAAQPILIWSLIGFVLMAACLPLALPGKGISLNSTTVLLPYECLIWSHTVHAMLSGLGMLLMTVAALRATKEKSFCAVLTVPAFALLLAGEIFGRLVFYLSYSRLGM